LYCIIVAVFYRVTVHDDIDSLELFSKMPSTAASQTAVEFMRQRLNIKRYIFSSFRRKHTSELQDITCHGITPATRHRWTHPA